MHVRQAKIQIRSDQTVRTSQDTLWLAKDPKGLQTDSENTELSPKLVNSCELFLDTETAHASKL